jgi:hypothetical protein
VSFTAGSELSALLAPKAAATIGAIGRRLFVGRCFLRCITVRLIDAVRCEPTVQALASESKATFFAISASSLTSKWMGQGRKLSGTSCC